MLKAIRERLDTDQMVISTMLAEEQSVQVLEAKEQMLKYYEKHRQTVQAAFLIQTYEKNRKHYHGHIVIDNQLQDYASNEDVREVSIHALANKGSLVIEALFPISQNGIFPLESQVTLVNLTRMVQELSEEMTKQTNIKQQQLLLAAGVQKKKTDCVDSSNTIKQTKENSPSPQPTAQPEQPLQPVPPAEPQPIPLSKRVKLKCKPLLEPQKNMIIEEPEQVISQLPIEQPAPKIVETPNNAMIIEQVVKTQTPQKQVPKVEVKKVGSKQGQQMKMDSFFTKKK